jgi:hypothetical protein
MSRNATTVKEVFSRPSTANLAKLTRSQLRGLEKSNCLKGRTRFVMLQKPGWCVSSNRSGP